MIANATKDAKERAEKIAENAGSSLGNLKKATMGVHSNYCTKLK